MKKVAIRDLKKGMRVAVELGGGVALHTVDRVEFLAERDGVRYARWEGSTGPLPGQPLGHTMIRTASETRLEDVDDSTD